MKLNPTFCSSDRLFLPSVSPSILPSVQLSSILPSARLSYRLSSYRLSYHQPVYPTVCLATVYPTVCPPNRPSARLSDRQTDIVCKLMTLNITSFRVKQHVALSECTFIRRHYTCWTMNWRFALNENILKHEESKKTSWREISRLGICRDQNKEEKNSLGKHDMLVCSLELVEFLTCDQDLNLIRLAFSCEEWLLSSLLGIWSFWSDTVVLQRMRLICIVCPAFTWRVDNGSCYFYWLNIVITRYGGNVGS